MNSDRYPTCPLKAAGFRLEHFSELPATIIGPDGKCVCTTDRPCLDVDKRDGHRCTLEQLRRLNAQAMSRRAWQSGEDY